MKLNQTDCYSFAIRIWSESSRDGTKDWRGTLVHPDTGKEMHFQGREALVDTIFSLLAEMAGGDVGGAQPKGAGEQT